MTDKQFEKIKKGLIFHSENGIDNLCTLTETALREILDEVSKDRVVEHFEAYGQCRDSRRIAELEAQIEKMKCCSNCENWNWKHSKCEKKLKGNCFKHSKWVMRNI